MMLWPRMGAAAFAMMRATTSVGPPGGNGTIRWMGRAGKFCAAAESVTPHAMTLASRAETTVRITDMSPPRLLRTSRSLRREIERLRDRSPFLDFRHHQVGQILRRAALRHVAEFGERRLHRIRAQARIDGFVELVDDGRISAGRR